MLGIIFSLFDERRYAAFPFSDPPFFGNFQHII